MASNEFYDSSGYPSSHGKGNSQQARAEFDAIEAGFVKLPTMLGNGLKLVQVNSGGTALEATGTPTLGAATATTINKITFTAPGTGATLTLINGTILTGPAATDTLVGRASTDTLTNKTLTAPTINGAITGDMNQFFTTGDVKLTLKTTADTGWVLMNDGTIGNASSSATSRANADTAALFTLLWNNTVNADCAVSTGRGGSAAADYAANKTIALPKALGRALAGYGAGSGLTSRALAAIVGEETHILITAEMPAHTHTVNTPHSTGALYAVDGNTGTAGTTPQTTSSSGSGTAHNNMQPTLFLNVMVKL